MLRTTSFLLVTVLACGNPGANGKADAVGGERPKAEQAVAALLRSEPVSNYAERSVKFVSRTSFEGIEVEPPKEFTRIVDAGAAAVPVLIQHLDDAARGVRLAALLALERITFMRSSDTYVFWEDDRAMVGDEREAAIHRWQDWWRKNSRRSRTDWLVDALRTGDAGTRGLAAAELGRLHEQRAIEPLRRALEDDVEYVREEAALSLGALGDVCAVPAIIRITLRGGRASVAKRGMDVLSAIARNAGHGAAQMGLEPSQVSGWESWWNQRGNEIARSRGCRQILR